MPTRRHALQAMAAFAAGNGDYDAAVKRTWRHTEAAPSDARAVQRELVRYATLAPNSHNTQPWKFELQPDAIVVRPDPARRCPAVDPDEHHVWVSLGCAVENLVQAAAAFGRQGEVSFEGGAIRVALSAMTPQRSPLFDAIPKRQSTRAEYDGRSLSAGDLRLLERAAAFPDVRAIVITEKPRVEQVLKYVTEGNTAQMADPAFLAELKHWIRFSEAEALASRDGLYTVCSGNAAVPRWIGSPLFRFFFTAGAENDRYAKQLRSSSGVVVFVASAPGAKHWVDVGRAYQRFALQSAALDIRNAFVNQPVEVPFVRGQFAQWLGIGQARPDLVVRFGRGRKMPPSLRRPVEAVIV